LERKIKTPKEVKMKKLTSFLILCVAATASAQLPQYYNYNTNGTNNSFPFNQAAGKMVQYLYLPGEFAQPTPAPSGNIVKWWFRIGDTYPLNSTYTNLYIRMGLAGNLTELPNGVFYTGPMDTVFFRASHTLSGAGGTWVSITLDRPFAYQNDQAMVIEIGQCASTQGTGFSVCNTTPSTNRRNWSVGGCPFTYFSRGLQIINSGVDIAPANCTYVWSVQSSGTVQNLWTVKAVNNAIGWAGGDSATVRKTTDGGATWTNGNPNPGIMVGNIYAIEALDANNAWCASWRSTGTTYIWKTTNGGANWLQSFSQAGGFINDVKFINLSTGFAYGNPVGGRWSLFKSTDGGSTWDSTGLYLQQAGSETGYNNAMFVSGNNIWFGTNNTRVYKSNNFGTTWTFGATTGQTSSYAVHFNSTSLGMIGGATGVLRTTDGGTTWAAAGSVPGSGNISGVEGFFTNFWCVRGPAIYRSSDNGDSWALNYTGSAVLADIDLIALSGCPDGWAVGSSGTIVRMISYVGIPKGSTEIPNVFKLEQNYPNPFNPVTVIGYQLSASSFVTLKVYDLLGREVATIVNENRPAGYYTVEFDATNLASGLYFYTLKAGDFTDTKKMLVVK